MRTTIAICVIAISALIGPPAWGALHTPADHVLDQKQENYNYSYTVGTPGAATMMAQTFTPDVTGVLCHVQIGNESGIIYDAASPPVVQIYNTQYGKPYSSLGSATPSPSYLMPCQVEEVDQDGKPLYGQDGEPLMSWITPPPDGSLGPVGWTPLIDFSVPVEAGVMYAIVLSSSIPSGTVSVSTTVDQTYAPLDEFGLPVIYQDYSGGELWTYDAGIWKDDRHLYDMQFRAYIVPVPLPAGVWLGICAVGIAGWHLKRQKA